MCVLINPAVLNVCIDHPSSAVAAECVLEHPSSAVAAECVLEHPSSAECVYRSSQQCCRASQHLKLGLGTDKVLVHTLTRSQTNA